jgi:hypothetical protein
MVEIGRSPESIQTSYAGKYCHTLRCLEKYAEDCLLLVEGRRAPEDGVGTSRGCARAI